MAQVTRNLLPRHLGRHALTNLLPELGVLGFLAVALASAVFLVRRGRSAVGVELTLPNAGPTGGCCTRVAVVN